jgi:hypothetical protein
LLDETGEAPKITGALATVMVVVPHVLVPAPAPMLGHVVPEAALVVPKYKFAATEEVSVPLLVLNEIAAEPPACKPLV